MDYFEIIRMILLVIIMSAAVVDYEGRCNAIFDGVYCRLRGNVSNIYS